MKNFLFSPLVKIYSSTKVPTYLINIFCDLFLLMVKTGSSANLETF